MLLVFRGFRRSCTFSSVYRLVVGRQRGRVHAWRHNLGGSRQHPHADATAGWCLGVVPPRSSRSGIVLDDVQIELTEAHGRRVGTCSLQQVDRGGSIVSKKFGLLGWTLKFCKGVNSIEIAVKSYARIRCQIRLRTICAEV